MQQAGRGMRCNRQPRSQAPQPSVGSGSQEQHPLPNILGPSPNVPCGSCSHPRGQGGHGGQGGPLHRWLQLGRLGRLGLKGKKASEAVGWRSAHSVAAGARQRWDDQTRLCWHACCVEPADWNHPCGSVPCCCKATEGSVHLSCPFLCTGHAFMHAQRDATEAATASYLSARLRLRHQQRPPCREGPSLLFCRQGLGARARLHRAPQRAESSGGEACCLEAQGAVRGGADSGGHLAIYRGSPPTGCFARQLAQGIDPFGSVIVNRFKG